MIVVGMAERVTTFCDKKKALVITAGKVADN